jgi:hypothetical protein
MAALVLLLIPAGALLQAQVKMLTVCDIMQEAEGDMELKILEALGQEMLVLEEEEMVVIMPLEVLELQGQLTQEAVAVLHALVDQA